jgi:AMP nucleosidase
VRGLSEPCDRKAGKGRYRAFYPQISLETTSFGMVDSRLSYGHVVSPGRYTATTITRPSLFRAYLTTQFELLLRNHGTPLTVSNRKRRSRCISPLAKAPMSRRPSPKNSTCRCATLFDTPDLATTDDEIVNGTL